jgi:hypothetical protein
MPLPEGFSEWEHLQSVLLQSYNRIVNEEFRDVGGDDFDDDITTPRGSLRTACRLVDSDSIPQSVARMLLFYFVLRQASDLQPPNYTIPADRYQESVRFAPQVTLYFREDLQDVQQGFKPIDSEISFRIINETYQSFTPANALALANKIKTEFTSGGLGYVWRKGRVKLNYRKKEDGYQFSVNAFSESEGRTVISKVVGLQNHTLDNSALSLTSLSQSPPIVPPTEVIYGQSRRPPRYRPVGNVRFRFAECHVWGIGKPITLVDATLRRANPLLRA